MKINCFQTITLTFLSLLLGFVPVLAQTSYKVTIKPATGDQVAQTFNSSGNIDQLLEKIYVRIKPSGNPLPRIAILLGSTDLKKFEKVVHSKGVSTEYYEFHSRNLIGKNFPKQIDLSSIDSTSKHYGVILKKPGYSETQVIPFQVTQISNNTPALRFSNSKVLLEDEKRILFILDTGNSGLDSNQIADALNSKDYRLLNSHYRNFQQYQNCQESIRQNPIQQTSQTSCGHVDFVVNVSY